jgi:hypothetical protein
LDSISANGTALMRNTLEIDFGTEKRFRDPDHNKRGKVVLDRAKWQKLPQRLLYLSSGHRMVYLPELGSDCELVLIQREPDADW